MTNGGFFRSTMTAEISAFEKQIGRNQGLGAECDDWFGAAPACTTEADPEILVWGDSYAMHLMQGILASNPDAKIAQAGAAMCGPLLGVAPIDRDYPRSWAKECIAHNDRVLDWLRRTPSVTHVVLSAEYSQYAAPHAKFITRDGKVFTGGVDASSYLVETSRAVAALGKVPVFVTPSPQDKRNIGRCLMKAELFDANPAVCDIKESNWRARMPHVAYLIDRMKTEIAVINLADALCTDGLCRASIDGVPIYRDQGHLTPAGSAVVGRKLNLYRRIIEAPPPQK